MRTTTKSTRLKKRYTLEEFMELPESVIRRLDRSGEIPPERLAEITADLDAIHNVLVNDFDLGCSVEGGDGKPEVFREDGVTYFRRPTDKEVHEAILEVSFRVKFSTREYYAVPGGFMMSVPENAGDALRDMADRLIEAAEKVDATAAKMEHTVRLDDGTEVYRTDDFFCAAAFQRVQVEREGIDAKIVSRRLENNEGGAS